jgi:hypothetical protein
MKILARITVPVAFAVVPCSAGSLQAGERAQPHRGQSGELSIRVLEERLQGEPLRFRRCDRRCNAASRGSPT